MRKIFGLALIGGSLLVWGCQPKPSTSDLLRNLVVTTYNDSTINFSNYSDFYLGVDTLMYVQNYDTTYFVDTQNSGKFVDGVTRRVSDKLIASGFIKTDTINKADMWVRVYIIEAINISQGYSYYPYGYYGGYYPTISVSDMANFYIEIVDPKKIVNGSPKTVWFCRIGDWVSAPQPYTQTLIAIDQAFKQSYYLKK